MWGWAHDGDVLDGLVGGAVAIVAQAGAGAVDLHVEAADGDALADLIIGAPGGEHREGVGDGDLARQRQPAAKEVMLASAMPISKARSG